MRKDITSKYKKPMKTSPTSPALQHGHHDTLDLANHCIEIIGNMVVITLENTPTIVQK